MVVMAVGAGAGGEEEEGGTMVPATGMAGFGGGGGGSSCEMDIMDWWAVDGGEGCNSSVDACNK